MNYFRNRKILIILPLILILIVAVCQTSVSFADTTTEAEKEEQFEVSADITSKTDEYFVIDITVTNKKEAFSGYVRLNIEEYSSTPYVEQTFFSISGNDTKTVQMLIPYPSEFDAANASFEVLILNEKEKVVEEHSLKGKKGFLAGASCVAGVLTSKPYELAYLDGCVFSRNNSSKSSVAETEEIITGMLTDPEYMRDFTFIIIDDYDTSKLDKESINAIEKWTSEGGILVFGTGSHTETLSGFDEAFTGVEVYKDTAGNTTHESSLEYYMTDESMVFANLSLSQDYNLSAGEVYSKVYGNGGIVIIPFSLEDDDFEESCAGDIVFSTMPSNVGLGANNIDLPSHTIIEASYMLQGKGRLSFWAIGTLIFMYIVLVGPLLYLILKAMNKREYVWFVIPLISLCFVGILFFIGRGFGTNRKQFYNISIAKADGSGLQHDFITCFDSGNSDWEAGLSKNLLGVVEADTDYSYSDKKPDLVISRDTKGLKAKMDPDSAFDLFLMKGLSNNTCTGDIETDISFSGVNIVGSVTNNTPYDFERLFINYGSSDIVLKNVKAGQTVNITGSEPVVNLSGYNIEDLYRKSKSKADKDAYAAIYLLENYYNNKTAGGSYSYVAGVVKDFDKLVESRCDEKSYGVIYRDLEEDYYAVP